MSRLGPPVVEPLSDITWARVERELWAAVDRGEAEPGPAHTAPLVAPPRRGWIRTAAAAGFLVAAAVALLVVWPRHRTPHGDLPSRVATAASPTTVSFGDAEITIDSESTLVLAGTPHRGVEIILERGSARFAVSPRRGRPPFVVHAGAVDVRVVGTEFTVARSGDAARVDVAHGEVEVVAHGRRERVLEGGTWDSNRDREATIRSSATVVNPDDVAAARTFSTPDAGERVKPAKPAKPPQMVIDPKAAYEAAAGLEPTDPAAALLAYRTLARGTGPWAANALYAAARLADQSDHALALELARQYQRRFPRGANVGDASQLINRLEGASHAPENSPP